MGKDFDLQWTDRGLKLSIDSDVAKEALLAATTAATLRAEFVEARHGEDSSPARELRTAARFGNDVVKFRNEGHGAMGQLNDILVLQAATAAAYRVYSRDHNKGGNPGDFEAAAEWLTDVVDTATRSLAIGRMRSDNAESEVVPYRFGDGEEE